MSAGSQLGSGARPAARPTRLWGPAAPRRGGGQLSLRLQGAWRGRRGPSPALPTARRLPGGRRGRAASAPAPPPRRQRAAQRRRAAPLRSAPGRRVATMAVLLETTLGDLVIDLYTEERPRGRSAAGGAGGGSRLCPLRGQVEAPSKERGRRPPWAAAAGPGGGGCYPPGPAPGRRCGEDARLASLPLPAGQPRLRRLGRLPRFSLASGKGRGAAAARPSAGLPSALPGPGRAPGGEPGPLLGLSQRAVCEVPGRPAEGAGSERAAAVSGPPSPARQPSLRQLLRRSKYSGASVAVGKLGFCSKCECDRGCLERNRGGKKERAFPCSWLRSGFLESLGSREGGSVTSP